MAAEIKAAQLKVKQEMLREIDAAKEEAEQQIKKQRNEYESAIENLQSQIVSSDRAFWQKPELCEKIFQCLPVFSL